MSKIIDLHIHTTCSDGVLSPKEVIDEAYNNGVSIIAISDHDTIQAHTDEVYEYAKSKNIKIIPAVEISTKTDRAGVHVLGYNIDLNNKELKEKLFSLRNSRHEYLRDVAKKLMELGYKINIEELDKIDAVTKSHISLDIIKNTENNELLLKEFNHIPSKGEFIETIMNEGCPAYVKKSSISPKGAAELIRSAGGKAILAHPVAYEYEDGLVEEDILNLVNDMKADGIEANYIYVSSDSKKINEIKKWNDFAIRNNLITTIGSDFHTKDGVHPVIGLINEGIIFNEKEIEKIIENLYKCN